MAVTWRLVSYIGDYWWRLVGYNPTVNWKHRRPISDMLWWNRWRLAKFGRVDTHRRPLSDTWFIQFRSPFLILIYVQNKSEIHVFIHHLFCQPGLLLIIGFSDFHLSSNNWFNKASTPKKKTLWLFCLRCWKMNQL